MSNTKAPHVYAAICQVVEELAKVGLSKERKNQQQGYAFRGIDDVMNVIAPLLPKANLCIIPRMLERDVQDKINKSGNLLIYTTVKADFDFVSAVDGSMHTVTTYGEAMDSGDKSTNKAMSAAYKYACLQAFCIPTEGDNDTENTTHELAPEQPQKTEKPNAPAPAATAKNKKLAPGAEEASKLKEALMSAGMGADKLKEYYVAAFSNNDIMKKATPQDYIPMLEWLLAAIKTEEQVADFNSDPASYGKQWNLNHAKWSVN